jgi:dUTP pyrophosphatase
MTKEVFENQILKTSPQLYTNSTNMTSSTSTVPAGISLEKIGASKVVRSKAMQLKPLSLLFKKFRETARLPEYKTQGAIGADVYSDQDTVVIAPGGRALIKTGLAVHFPDQHSYLRIAPRSGLAWKSGIDVGAGVIDYDYNGEIGVILFNHGSEPFTVLRGDAVAQLILERAYRLPIEEVSELPDKGLAEHIGFGSTGNRHTADSSKGSDHHESTKLCSTDTTKQETTFPQLCCDDVCGSENV